VVFQLMQALLWVAAGNAADVTNRHCASIFRIDVGQEWRATEASVVLKEWKEKGESIPGSSQTGLVHRARAQCIQDSTLSSIRTSRIFSNLIRTLFTVSEG